MEYKEARSYVCSNLGIDLDAGSFCMDMSKVEPVLSDFPYRGILLSAGSNHLIKVGILCSELLQTDKIQGSIERVESWEIPDLSTTVSLLICTNLAEDLVKPQTLIRVVSDCMKYHIPMMFTTPLETEGLENSLPVSVISNIVPYLYGKV